MSTFIPLTQLISFEVNVSEEIDYKNLKDFILTSFQLNNKKYEKKDLIYITYLEELNQYQIIAVNEKYENIIFQVFELFYEKESIGFDLYIGDNFFCLYKNGSFYYYQTMEFILPIDEFLAFINKKFNTKIDNYKKIEKNELENLKIEYLSQNRKTNLKNINKEVNHSFKFYALYLFLLIFLFSNFLLNEENKIKEFNVQNKHTLELEKFKNEHIFISFEQNFNQILQNIRKHNLIISFLEYKQNNLKIIVTTSNKNDLYAFLNDYKLGLNSSSINYNETKNIYELVTNVSLFK